MISFLSTYSYLVGSLYLVALWIVLLFLSSTANRRESVAMGMLGIFANVANSGIYQSDWWHPTRFMSVGTIFGPIGIEDFLFGASVFGIASIIGDYLLNRKEKKPTERFWRSFLAIFLFSLVVFILFIFLLKAFSFYSFYATTAAWLAAAAFLLWKRTGLFREMLSGGVLLVLAGIPFYAFPLLFHPTWITDEWFLPKLSGVLIGGVPVEEFLWFFMIGSVVSVVWEWARSIRFVKG